MTGKIVLIVAAQVLWSQVAPDQLKQVSIADYDKHSQFDLYTTSTITGTRIKIGRNIEFDHDVSDAVISGDSSRVAYRYGQTSTGDWELYSTGITAKENKKISQNGGRVEPILSLAFNGTAVRYRWAEVPGAEPDYYVVGFNGGRILREVFADGFESGGVTRWS